MSRLMVRAMGVAGTGMLVSWLLLAGNSPIADWLATRVLLTNLASAINLPTVLFALSGFPGNAEPSNAAVALVGLAQWLAYGFAAAWPWCMLSPGPSSTPD